MPSKAMAARTLSDGFPSLMSCYCQRVELRESSRWDPSSPDIPPHGALPRTSSSALPDAHLPTCIYRPTTSASAESSPTASSSLFNSPLSLETPSTSPDSPASTSSMRSYTGDARPPTFPHLKRPVPQARKPRNLKNLAVDTSSALPLTRTVSSSVLPAPSPLGSNFPSEPSSPAFIKPMRTVRKNSTLSLSIVTPSSSSSPSPTAQTKFAVPPTPTLVRPASLRRFQSSPLLPILAPGLGPEGGMRLPTLTSCQEVAVGFSEIREHAEEDQHPNFDVPQSRDDQPASYPDGPICIYDPHVYLYSEPTARIASDYDVIFNVASEVLNPFLAANAAAAEPSPNDERQITTSYPQAADDSVSNDKLELAAEGADLESAIDEHPEYIHVPWEHNTDIVPDLYHLVKAIDERVQQGKKVLIHCQCGVSRSASLIVAYGLYRNPSVTVQDAYDAVKRRSRWIGPNMSLIMQLQEFRSGLLRSNAGFGQPRSRIKYSRRGTLNVGGLRRDRLDLLSTSSFAPHSAPLDGSNNSSPTGAQLVSPGPSSAPMASQFSLGAQVPMTTTTTTTLDVAPSLQDVAVPVVDPAGHLLKISAQELAQTAPGPLLPTAEHARTDTAEGIMSAVDDSVRLQFRVADEEAGRELSSRGSGSSTSTLRARSMNGSPVTASFGRNVSQDVLDKMGEATPSSPLAQSSTTLSGLVLRTTDGIS